MLIQNNIDKIFNAHQSGGRIKSRLKLFNIFYRRIWQRYLAQKKIVIYVKILKLKKFLTIINLIFYQLAMEYTRITFWWKNKYIISTEHGPFGGDEINILKNSDIKKGISNFGWPLLHMECIMAQSQKVN